MSGIGGPARSRVCLSPRRGVLWSLFLSGRSITQEANGAYLPPNMFERRTFVVGAGSLDRGVANGNESCRVSSTVIVVYGRED